MITEVPDDVLFAMYNLREVSNDYGLDVEINFEKKCQEK